VLVSEGALVGSALGRFKGVTVDEPLFFVCHHSAAALLRFTNGEVAILEVEDRRRIL